MISGTVCCQHADRLAAIRVRIDEQIAALPAYLGHVSPAQTYWYLTATPELMGAAAQRLDLRFGARS
jgi:integrase/recombinase XerD